MSNNYRDLKEGDITLKQYEEKEDWLYKDAFPDKYEGVGSPSEAAARQVGGTHYNKHTIQPWNIIDEYGLDYYRGNAIKYILRNKMNPREDIEKAIHYLEYWLELSDAS